METTITIEHQGNADVVATLVTSGASYGAGPGVQTYNSEIPCIEVRQGGFYGRYDLDAFVSTSTSLEIVLPAEITAQITAWALAHRRRLEAGPAA